MRAVSGLGLLWLLSACSAVENHCEATDAVTPVCGISMPEDLVVLPNGGGLIVSEFGKQGMTLGRLSWYRDGDDAQYESLLEYENLAVMQSDTVWGDAECEPPERFSPHGAHLREVDGSLRLAVVNHGWMAETVQLFEVQQSSPEQAPELSWRGCIRYPDHAYLNDVVLLPDGEVAATHMYSRMSDWLGRARGALGFNTGYVYRWSPDDGLSIIDSSKAPMPNGIEVDAAGEILYVNNYLGDEVRAIALDSGEVIGTASIPHIDNSAWMPDGRLLIASHRMSLNTILTCFNVLKGSCGGAYDLVALDPASMATEVLFQHDGGGPFGAATVAVFDGQAWFAGSFSGDRLARFNRRFDQ